LKSMPKHKDIDVIVTSPPYMSQASENPNVHKYRKGGKFAEEKVDAIITSPPFRTGSQGGGLNQKPPKTFRGVLKKHTFKLSDDPKNVDNLQYGSVDAIVTSPPYSDANSFKADRYEQFFKKEVQLKKMGDQRGHAHSLQAQMKYVERIKAGQPESSNNIGNLPYEEPKAVEEEAEFDEEWDFPSVSTKLQRPWYVEESVSHPAKMNVLLARKIIKQYTKPGDTVLDPMTGCGTVNVEAMLLGRDTIAVDLEKKFTDLVEANIRKVKETNAGSHFPLKLGEANVICGDARNLSKLLGPQANAIVTSPPFADGKKGDVWQVGLAVERGSRFLRHEENPVIRAEKDWNRGCVCLSGIAFHDEFVAAVHGFNPFDNKFRAYLMTSEDGVNWTERSFLGENIIHPEIHNVNGRLILYYTDTENNFRSRPLL